MRELTVFVGGSVGNDPYAPKTWSGSSAGLLRAMDAAGVLDKAVGIKVPLIQNALLQVRNYARDRAVWRRQYYLDPAYRKTLTRAAGAVTVSSPFLLQFGHMFSLPAAFPDARCVSYHDGNLAQSLASGFGMQGVSRRRLDQALQYEQETAAGMAAVFTFSEYLRQSFIHDYHLAPEKVFNVGGAVNMTEFPPPAPGKNYTANRILFIGIEFERKGGPQLLEAFAKVRKAVPNAELHIVGPEKLETLPAGAVLYGRLLKDDPAQAATLESLFRESTLFVLPSLYEPFGIAPLEAMFYQLPCLLTDDWAFRECVTPGVNGDLLRKGSVDDLASKMIELLADPVALAAMGERARERVLTRYTWTAVVGRMADVLGEL